MEKAQRIRTASIRVVADNHWFDGTVIVDDSGAGSYGSTVKDASHYCICDINKACPIHPSL